MANLYVAKDNHSFYIMNMFENVGDQITYDWSLSKSYSVIVSKGTISIGSETRSTVGIHTIAPNTQITMEAQEANSIALCAFLLNDSTTMSELFNTTTLTQLIDSPSNLIELAVDLPAERLTPQLTYAGMTSPITFSLFDLDARVLGAI